MTTSAVSPASTAQQARASSQSVSAADTQRFSQLRSAEQAEESSAQTSTVTEEDLWKAVDQGFIDAIVRSGIRRTINHINEMKALYRNEM